MRAETQNIEKDEEHREMWIKMRRVWDDCRSRADHPVQGGSCQHPNLFHYLIQEANGIEKDVFHF